VLRLTDALHTRKEREDVRRADARMTPPHAPVFLSDGLDDTAGAALFPQYAYERLMQMKSGNALGFASSSCSDDSHNDLDAMRVHRRMEQRR
jgi:hypothetical protein